MRPLLFSLVAAASLLAAPLPFPKPEKPAKYDNWFDHWDEPRAPEPLDTIHRTAEALTIELSPFSKRGSEPHMLTSLKGDFVMVYRVRLAFLPGGKVRKGGGFGADHDKKTFIFRIMHSAACRWWRVARRDRELMIEHSEDGKKWSAELLRPIELASENVPIGVFAEAERGVGLRATFDRLKITVPPK